VFINSVDNLVKENVLGETETPEVVKTYHEKLVAAAKNRSIAVAFLKRADRRAYGNLWTELKRK